MVSQPAAPTSAPARSLRTWLAEGPFTLAMSSGFFGFFAHAGLLSVLVDEGLLPDAAAGSSAGALVAGAHAAGLSADALVLELSRLERRQFWDPSARWGASRRSAIVGGLLQGGLLRGELFRARLRALLPVATFDACRIPLSVSTFDVATRRTHVVRDGELASAIAASCAVPGLFRPVAREGRWLLDGGIRDRPGIAGVPSDARVLFHHLSSRSPWRTKADMALPARAGLTSLVIEGLPRAGPNDLDAGKRAMHLAREAALRALDVAVADGVVRVHTR